MKVIPKFLEIAEIQGKLDGSDFDIYIIGWILYEDLNRTTEDENEYLSTLLMSIFQT